MREIPPLARWLGVALMLPSLGALAALVAGPAGWQRAALIVIHGWTALTLALAGGCWWGLAAGAPAAERRGGFGWVWIAGFVAVIGALACLLGTPLGQFGHEPALIMLGAAQLVGVGVDARLGPLAPRWWLALRLVLAGVLGLAAAAAALA